MTNIRTHLRLVSLAATLLAGTFAHSAVQAQDVNVQLRVITPHIRLPGHVVLPLPPLIVPRVVVSAPAPAWQSQPAPYRRDHGYREPARWDADGDGIPNRHDRVYNPRWDRDGDGVPNRYDSTPHGNRGWHAQRDWREPAREEHRGEGRADRRDDRRADRRDERRDDRHDEHRRGRHD